jgi:hypothetical protein
MGGDGAKRPVWGGNELKKTGERSARARTRGQNPLVINMFFSVSYINPHFLEYIFNNLYHPSRIR